MRQWVKLVQFRTFIFRGALKGLTCEFRQEFGEGSPSDQNLYGIESEDLARRRVISEIWLTHEHLTQKEEAMSTAQLDLGEDLLEVVNRAGRSSNC